MNAATEAPDITTHELCNALERYINRKEHSNDVDERWLAHYLTTFRAVALEVRNSRLGPGAKAQVNAFRAAEIEKELQDKRRQMEVLERDLKKLKEIA